MGTRGSPLELPPWEDDEGARRRGPTPGDLARLALGALRRRPWIATLVFLAGLGASGVYYSARMRTPRWRVETRLLAQRPQALPSVVRSIFEDAPTRSAWEIVHRRDNLISLLRESGVLPQEAPSGGEEEKLGKLVRILDKQLVVSVEDGTITIAVDWDDPREAYDIVKGALQNFLEARHLQEVTATDEVLDVLSGQAAALRNDLDVAVEQARRRDATAPRIVAPRPRQPSEVLVRLQSRLESKHRAIQDVEELRRRRLAELQAQLDQSRNTLSDAHPTVIGLRKEIAAFGRDSPQLESLREEERVARKEYQAQLAREGFEQTGVPLVAATPAVDVGAREEDPRVRELRLQYEQLMLRIQAAQVERDAARAAFKYRYNVIWPPQLPSEPVGPSPLKIGLLALLGSLALSLAIAAAPDLLRGRIVERWQVERALELPVLGEIRRRL